MSFISLQREFIEQSEGTSEGRTVQGESQVTWSSRRCRDNTRCWLHFPTVQHWKDASYLQQDSWAVHVTRSHCHFVFTDLPKEDTTEVRGDTITSLILCQIGPSMNMSIICCVSIFLHFLSSLVPAWGPLCKRTPWQSETSCCSSATIQLQCHLLLKLGQIHHLLYLSSSVQGPHNPLHIPAFLPPEMARNYPLFWVEGNWSIKMESNSIKVTQ